VAQPPYNPVPSVGPAPPSGAYENIPVSPAETGGLIGQAERGTGAELSQAGAATVGTAIDLQHFQNQIVGNDAFNRYQKSIMDITAGTPQPDGTMKPGYFSLQGKAALDAYPATEQALTSARENISGGLNQAQKLLFDESSRRLQMYTLDSMRSHFIRQQNVYGTTVNQATQQNAERAIGISPADETNFYHNVEQMRQGAVREVQTLGNGSDPVVVDNAVKISDQKAIIARAQALQGSDPLNGATAALAWLRDGMMLAPPGPDGKQSLVAVKDRLEPNIYDQLQQHLQSKADEQAGHAAAQRASLGAFGPTPLPGTVAPDQMHAALIGQESGGRQTDAAGNTLTSVDNAKGVGQILPATFAQYALPGENINNRQDNINVSQRITNDYYNRYGGDPARVAVAYFSGPNNVAPAGSPTPWINDTHDGNGKYVSSYVNDVQQRLSGGKAAAYRSIMADPTLNDNARQHAFTALNQQYTAAQVALEASTRAKVESDESAADEWSRKINENPPPDIESQINNDPRITSWRTRQSLIALAQNKTGVDDIRKYGPGYTQAYNRIVAPDSDPNKIGDSAAILQRGAPGGDLTASGVTRLMSVFRDVHKDVDMASIHTQAASLMAGVKPEMSYETQVGNFHIADPEGERIYHNIFVPKFMQGLDEAIKTGKQSVINDYLSEKNVTAMVSSMPRSKAQMARDRLAATGQTAPGDVDQPNTPLPPPPSADINASAWNNILSVPPTAPSGQVYTHAAWAEVMRRLLANPEKGVKDFNEKFGKAGYDGAEILHRLTTKPLQTDEFGNPATGDHILLPSITMPTIPSLTLPNIRNYPAEWVARRMHKPGEELTKTDQGTALRPIETQPQPVTIPELPGGAALRPIETKP
jgi:hypothetical protein